MVCSVLAGARRGTRGFPQSVCSALLMERRGAGGSMIVMPIASINPLRVVIAGGGVGALEALMALHDLGEQQLAVTLIAPDDDFVLRPMAVAVPFSEGHVTRVPLDDICARFGARRVRTALYSVDPDARLVTCDDGEVLEYDRLVLAIGAGTRDAYVSALTFHDRDPVELNGLLADIEQGYVSSVALVVPPAGSWALPIYELALMLAKYTRAVEFPETKIHLVTPEAAPLSIFGPQASSAMQDLLTRHGITVHAASYATIERHGRIAMAPGGRHLEVQRIVALPIIVGRAIDGVPSDDHGFIPIDDHCRVLGLNGVYAVGDDANFPVKQGGLAAQQADAAAKDICADAGAPVEREPFRPILRGMLLTGAAPRFLRHPAAGGAGESRFSADRLWWPPTKVVGHYLAPWLARETGVDTSRPADGVHVETELPPGPDSRPLALTPLGAELPRHGRW
jgi:sulfide:quinone oxidoreductase